LSAEILAPAIAARLFPIRRKPISDRFLLRFTRRWWRVGDQFHKHEYRNMITLMPYLRELSGNRFPPATEALTGQSMTKSLGCATMRSNFRVARGGRILHFCFRCIAEIIAPSL
jgi:hypothetical protein